MECTDNGLILGRIFSFEYIGVDKLWVVVELERRAVGTRLLAEHRFVGSNHLLDTVPWAAVEGAICIMQVITS